MRSLAAHEYARIVPLVQQSGATGFTAMVYSVLEGRRTGTVLVDDAAEPQTVLIHYPASAYLAYNWGHLIGNAENLCFRRFIPELLSKHLPAGGCFLFPTSPAWQQELETLFHRNFGRVMYEYPRDADESAAGCEASAPPGFTLEAMDGSLTERHGAGRHGGVMNSEDSFGFCLMCGQEWASHCYSNLIGGGEAEIIVETRSQFQRQGLATCAGRAFIRECLARGLRPAWSCDPFNAASAATARKLGFVPREEIPGYYVHEAFLMWRDAERGTFGPCPDVIVPDQSEPGITRAVQEVLRHALDEGVCAFEIVPDSRGVSFWHQRAGGAEEVTAFAKEMQGPLTAYLKGLAGMNVEKQAVPQAGRFTMRHGEHDYTVRLRVHPSPYGEKIVGTISFS